MASKKKSPKKLKKVPLKSVKSLTLSHVSWIQKV